MKRKLRKSFREKEKDRTRGIQEKKTNMVVPNRSLAQPLDLADAAIAATAIINGYQLATLNKKDFAGIEGLETVEL